MNLSEIQITLAKNLDSSRIIDFWKANDITLSSTDNPLEVSHAATINPQLFLVALYNNDIAGTVWGNFDGRRGFVVHFAVRKDVRKMGIGKLLMDRLEDEFRAISCKKVHLFIEKTNLAVEPYYARRGYKKRDDLILMSKDL